jgi:hypothetical protein
MRDGAWVAPGVSGPRVGQCCAKEDAALPPVCVPKSLARLVAPERWGRRAPPGPPRLRPGASAAPRRRTAGGRPRRGPRLIQIQPDSAVLASSSRTKETSQPEGPAGYLTCEFTPASPIVRTCPGARVAHAEISLSGPPPTRRGRGSSSRALPAAAHPPPVSPCLLLSRVLGPASSHSAAVSWVAVPQTGSAPGAGRPAAGTPAPRTSGRSCSQGKDDLASLVLGVNLVNLVGLC